MVYLDEGNLKIFGKIIYLMPIEEKYLDVYYDKLIHASEESNRNTGSKIEITREGLKNFINKISGDSLRLDFFIVNKENDEIVGEVVINEVDCNNRSANTRIMIYHEKDFNKNFGSEAMRLALEHGFKQFKLHRIELKVYSFNKRAIHVYEKLGFKQEGVLRDCLYYENQFHDGIVMSILESEFKK